MPRHTFTALAVLLLLPCVAPAQPARTHTVTIDDYFTQADIGQIALSPKGTYVAYTESRWQESTDDRKAELWLTPVKPSKARRLTADRASYRSPAWSPDERWIYVLANRKREGEKRPPYNGKAQVWRIAADGGEAQPVTTVEGGVEAFALAKSGDAVYYLVHRPHVDKEWQALRKKFGHLEYGHGANKVSEIWKLDLDTWRAAKIVDDTRYIREFAVSRDGKIAMITAPDDTVVSSEGRSRVDVFDNGKVTALPDKVWRAEPASPWAWLEDLAWSGDGQALAFCAIFDAYPAEIIVTRWDKATPRSFVLPRPKDVHVRGYGSPLQWRSDMLYFLGEEKARVRLYGATFAADGKVTHYTATPGEVVVENFDVGSGARYITVQADATHFADIFATSTLVSDSREPMRLTRVNPQTDTWKLPQVSIVSWKGARGDTVEGVLELPSDYKPGQRVPLMLEIHGGPTMASYAKQQYWIYGRTLWPARGIAVLAPNYRGSTGYGDKFVTDLIAHENNIEVEDMLKGVDYLVERGIADPERLGVSGWSNGGYLTNCLITHTTRFKAAISGASIVDAVMEWGANDEPAYTMVFKQGLPWNKSSQYHKASPTYQLDKIRTPTLIHVGANDERCPPGHSRTLYRALKEYVNVPTELIVYPGEGHGLSKYKNRRAKMEWDVAWLERYLLAKKR